MPSLPKLCLSLFLLLFLAGAANAGSVIIAGTDADDHGTVNAAGNNIEGWLLMQRSLEALARSVNTSQPGFARVVVDLGSSQVGPVGRTARDAINSAFNNSLLPSLGWTLVHIDDSANVASWLDNISTSNTGILYMPSFGTTSGGLDSFEMQAVNARADQIAGFVNGVANATQGGGLFTLSQTGGDAAFGDLGFGWLPTLIPGIIAQDRLAGGVNTPIALTATGISVLTDISADVAHAVPWHNDFRGNLGGLDVLGLGAEVSDPNTLRNVILGGGLVPFTPPNPIPEPSSMVLFAVGLLGLGARHFLTRRRA